MKHDTLSFSKKCGIREDQAKVSCLLMETAPYEKIITISMMITTTITINNNNNWQFKRFAADECVWLCAKPSCSGSGRYAVV
jgi:hypothetical protein